jgi:hypothetical protein
MGPVPDSTSHAPGAFFVWLTIEVVSALYLVSFAWFWSLCQLSVPAKTDTGGPPQKSNLIPFERGEKRFRQKNQSSR